MTSFRTTTIAGGVFEKPDNLSAPDLMALSATHTPVSRGARRAGAVAAIALCRTQDEPRRLRFSLPVGTIANALEKSGVTRRDLLATRRDSSQMLLRDAKDYGNTLKIVLHEFYRNNTSNLALSPELCVSVIRSILAGEILDVAVLAKFHRLLITKMILMYEHLEVIQRNNETGAPNFDLVPKMDRMDELAGILHEIMKPYME